MRGRGGAVGGEEGEFHSDSKCKLVVKDGGRRRRRQAVKREGRTEEGKVPAMV